MYVVVDGGASDKRGIPALLGNVINFIVNQTYNTYIEHTSS